MEEEKLFINIGSEIDKTVQSQMFGKPCFKINGKAFICFFQNEMVFKLTGDNHQYALNLEGAKLFDPSGKNRAMKEWVQIPYTHSEKWKTIAIQAYNYVSNS